MLEDVLAVIVRVLFRCVVEVGFFYTGEIVLFVVTLGRHRPRWDFYVSEGGAAYAFLTEFSTWIGAAIWIGAFVHAVRWPS